MEQPKVSIGVAARMTGINQNTLRMWERRYQLQLSQRSQGGQREYSLTDIDHLRLIKQLMDQGMRIGDIAQLPAKALTELLLDVGNVSIDNRALTKPIQAQVVGITLSSYFRTHIKRYPKLAIELSDTDTEEWLNVADINGKDVLILQQRALTQKHVDTIMRISERKIHVIVLYLYSHQDILQTLQRQGIILLRGDIEPSRLDDAINKVSRLVTNLSTLEKSSEKFNIALPRTQPRQFDEAALIAAEALSNKLNCECPQHLTDLIRRLNAFEEYSQNCGAENWKQAAVHACIYAYANQAKHLIEKALRTVLDE